jgi:hypothetical protein
MDSVITEAVPFIARLGDNGDNRIIPAFTGDAF